MRIVGKLDRRVPQDFVWGDPWSWTIPPVDGAASYDITQPLPAGVTFISGSSYGGTVWVDAPLGSTPFAVQPYDEFAVPVGPEIEYPDLTTSFRIYYGECDELPDLFTRSEILALLDGDNGTGPRELLVTTGRNVELAFPATTSAKYRVIAMPMVLPTGKDINRIRYADHSAPAWVVDPIAGPYGYEPDPYSGFNDPIYLDPGEAYVSGVVYVVPATSAAFSLFLRHLDEVGHSFVKSMTATDWTDATNTIPQLASTEILISADIQVTTVWNGALWIENTDAGSATVNRAFSTAYTVDIGASISMPWTLTYTASPVTLAGFDGNLNYFGSSAHQLNGLVLSKIQNETFDSGSELSQFVGAGTVTVSLAADGTFTKSGDVSSSVLNTSTASVTVSVTYHYYAS